MIKPITPSDIYFKKKISEQDVMVFNGFIEKFYDCGRSTFSHSLIKDKLSDNFYDDYMIEYFSEHDWYVKLSYHKLSDGEWIFVSKYKF